ncbi:MAG: dihydroorotate dehydrogenase [Hyphomicrobiales bacterium]|nr:MAG: dihydroorotate dehydrogenase [Hyphomicrobiales bacterium]
MHSQTIYIYKLLTSEQWQDFSNKGVFLGAPIDLADGYIHFSTAAQAAETAAKHFSAVEGLVIAQVSVEPIKDHIKWEPSRGGALFPHLYTTLPLDAVTQSAELLLTPDGLHIFPDWAQPE